MCNAVFRTPFTRCPLDGTKLAELDGDPLVGTVLDKRYLVEECIGEGGMGRVYRAKHTRMSRTYAIKILFGDHAGDTRMRSRFAREAEAVSRLNHTNVISVVDFGETEEGLLYLVMDLADGESLSDLVHREAPLEANRSVDILARLAKGLSHAHNHGLVHRDFKCENVIMVEEEGVEVPKIVDFGICMIIEDAASATMLTSSGMIMGTPAVMAPEQASGDKVDHRTDLFSLGIVGYQMVSGCLPFEGSPLEMARKNLYEVIPPISERSGVNVDPGLEAVIMKLTAKSPDDRYQDAREVIEALQCLGLADTFDSWTSATPLPSRAPLHGGAVQNRAPTPSPGTNPGFDATESVSPFHLDPHLQSQNYSLPKKAGRAKYALAAVAVIALVGGIYAVVASGGSSKSSTEIAESGGATAAAGVSAPDTLGQDTAGQDTNNSAAAQTMDAGTEEMAASDAAAELEVPDETATKVPEVAIKEPSGKRASETKKERQRRLAAARKAKQAREAKRNPTKGLSKTEKDALFAKTLSLHSRVAGKLDALEQLVGNKSRVSSLRAEFKSINRSKLNSDRSLQPSYYKRLVKLQARIGSRRRQEQKK